MALTCGHLECVEEKEVGWGWDTVSGRGGRDGVGEAGRTDAIGPPITCGDVCDVWVV